jgi:dTMP kinase
MGVLVCLLSDANQLRDRRLVGVQKARHTARPSRRAATARGDTVRGAMPTGRLITIEGLDGAGKTTLAEGLTRELAERYARGGGGQGDRSGRGDPGDGANGNAGRAVELLREPGGVRLSERIRELVKDPGLAPVDARAEALLYAAARAQLVRERVRPLLERGALVLLDRFVDSSLAYQGAGRELGVEQIRAINRFATGDLTPDRTLLLCVSPRSGRARQSTRGDGPDRMELEGEGFFARIDAAYRDLAREEPQRIVALDAELPPEQVLRDALAAIDDLL